MGGAIVRYAVLLEKDPDSDWGVTVPDLPGCFSAGTTLDEALEIQRILDAARRSARERRQVLIEEV